MQYFYISNNQRLGPFSFDELKKQPLRRDSLVWFYGMEDWMRLENIETLEELSQTLPPSLIPTEKFLNVPPVLQKLPTQNQRSSVEKLPTGAKKRMLWDKFYLVGFVVSVAIIIYLLSKDSNQNGGMQKEVDYELFTTNAYPLDFDYNFYLTKYYRDLNAVGISPVKPRFVTIKFVDMQFFKGLTHYHGISFGMSDDSKVEIYLNKDSWDSFNRGEKFWVMYHELSHDILNYDHTPSDKLGEGSLMDPYFSTLDNISMDDFIEAWYVFMEHYME